MKTVLYSIPVRDAHESPGHDHAPGACASEAPELKPPLDVKLPEAAPVAETAAVPTGERKPGNRQRRRRLLLLFATFLALAAASWWLWANLFAGDIESTENAYTNVELAQVTPLVSAPVKRVRVVESQRVAAGDVLVELDDADLRLAVSQAEAALGKARRRVWQLEANDASLEGQEQVRAAEEATARADLARAQADLDKALLDEDRAQKLSIHGWAPTQRLDDAHTSVRQARAAVAQAQARIAVSQAAQQAAAGARRANQALLEDATVETNPEVAAARAQLDQALLDLDRAIIRAPVDGIVDQRRIAVGQRVQAGAPIMVVVPLQDMHVDANFKEVQLARVRPGQPVRLTSDLYGSDVVFRGRVGGFAGGTGAAFAAIPAQNATGNWIKVVQRLPVRIELDPAELRAHPLRVGLSMHATIDLSEPH
ncbi:HlyD family secretion protein [Ancylobacter sp. A5.8]|uniref:HlyD family secretion protein n=1 Tax=Ancylobacter gelatini TaxID=2919920 RepID=UPI001F4EDFD5|nr:HlyD family secretion protein [Ancylobacter gelatini]MCJ8141780.1 HlyD family secretion protein [Ancylobacter gelatini]